MACWLAGALYRVQTQRVDVMTKVNPVENCFRCTRIGNLHLRLLSDIRVGHDTELWRQAAAGVSLGHHGGRSPRADDGEGKRNFVPVVAGDANNGRSQSTA